MKLALLLVALLTASGAHAATFDLSVMGSGTHWYVDGVPGCDFSDPVGGCQFGYATEGWIGDLTIQTASDGDGTYAYGAGLESVTYGSNFDRFTYSAGDTQHLVYPHFSSGEPYFAGMRPGASVTVVGGQVTSFTGSFVWDGSGSLDFTSLSVADVNGGQIGQPGADWWQLSGVLGTGSNPAASPASEPTNSTLLVSSIVALVITRIARCAGRRSPGSSLR